MTSDSTSAIAWLMEGDPVIRWQTMRDLLGSPEEDWRAERQQTVATGWGARFLEHLRPDGTWPDGRWTGSVWTFQTVMDCGLPADCERLRHAATRFLDSHLTPERAADTRWLLSCMDLCHLGFWLRIGAYFVGNDARLVPLANTILGVQMEDGGWNCRIRTAPKSRHSSFHTTFNVLEALAMAADSGVISRSTFRKSEARAMEFMLAHQMYRSDKTGQIVSDRFTHLSHPSHWHYTVLRGLDYMRNCPEVQDARLADPIAMLESRRAPNGHWPVEKRIAGTTLFDMEKFGGESRWNTLRCLRVLKAREAA